MISYLIILSVLLRSFFAALFEVLSCRQTGILFSHLLISSLFITSNIALSSLVFPIFLPHYISSNIFSSLLFVSSSCSWCFSSLTHFLISFIFPPHISWHLLSSFSSHLLKYQIILCYHLTFTIFSDVTAPFYHICLSVSISVMPSVSSLTL